MLTSTKPINSMRRQRPSTKLLSTAVVCATSLMLAGCGGDDAIPTVPAQLVYRNGSVLTLDDSNTLAQAVAVRDRKIVAIGSNRTIDAFVGADTKVVDLQGKTLIPGIYDAHSHFTLSGTNELFDVNLNSVPIGPVENMAQLIALVKTQQAKVAATDWISGWGYDDTLIAEKRHPTRADLDMVSATQPIFITHVSGHFAVANSAALAKAGITAATPNPTGGTIRRDANGQPNGVLEETAVQMVSTLKPAFTAAQLQAGIAAASKQYASQGVTTANEGATYAPAVAALETAGQSGALPIRVIAWPVYDYRAGVDQLKLTSGKVKVGGVKDFSDGSIQGYTGYLSHPYHVPFSGDVNYRGSPRIVRDVLAQRVLAVHKAGRQSLIHGNGDEAISDILFAYRNAQQTLPRPDARHTVIHSQMGTEAQLDDMKSLGVIPSFFVLHTYYWGDRHRDIFLGPERAARISPTKSALTRGMRFTIHADTPVVPMEPMRLIWSAVNRVTTSGKVIGPEQRISPLEALRATTINSAYQNFEEKERGSIEIGKYADLVVLSANPTTVDPMGIKDIKVMETVVEGQSVYAAP